MAGFIPSRCLVHRLKILHTKDVYFIGKIKGFICLLSVHVHAAYDALVAHNSVCIRFVHIQHSFVFFLPDKISH